MITELGFHRPGDLARLHAEQRIREGLLRVQGIASGPVELTALVRGADVLGVLLRQLPEVLARFRLREDLLRTFERRRVVLLIADQDLPRAAPLGLDVLALVLLVGSLQVLIAHGLLGSDLVEAQLAVLHVGRLRPHVVFLVRLVVRLHGCVVGLRIGRELVRGQQGVTHLALLVLQRAHPLRLRQGHEIGNSDGVFQLRALQRAAHLRLELRQRDPQLLQGKLRRLRRIDARDLKSRLALDGLEKIILTDAIAELVGALGEQQVAHHRLEHLILEERLLLRGDVAAEALLPLALLPLPGAAGILDADLVAPRLGGVVGRTEAEVDDSVSAPGGENHGQCSEHRVGEPLV